MTTRLYFSPGACSFVPHVMLEMAGVPFEPVMVKIHKGENYGPEYRAINPRSQVPVLVDGGETITQIVAIINYLNDRFPQQGFLPTEPLARARAMETLMWMNNTVHPTFTHIFMPHKYTANPAIHDDLRAHNTELFRGMLDELEAMLAAAQGAGKAWLSGDAAGPLDAYSLTLLRWGSIAGIDPLDHPLLWAHIQKFAQLPAVARAIERERLQLNLYKPKPKAD